MAGWYTLFALGPRVDGGFCMPRHSVPAELGTFGKVLGDTLGFAVMYKIPRSIISSRGKVDYRFIIKLC